MIYATHKQASRESNNIFQNKHLFPTRRRRQSITCNSQTLSLPAEMEQSGSREDEGVYLTIPRGGPIYVPNLVGPLTRVPDFESAVFNQLQSLKDILCSDSSQPCDDDDLDISVDELKIFTEEELVDMAMKEAFKEGDDDAQNAQFNGGGNDPGTSSNNLPCFENSGRGGDALVPLESSNISPDREHGAIVPVESSNGVPSRNVGCKVPSKRVPKNTKKSIVPSKQIPRKRKKARPADDDAYIAKVEQLAKIKQKQEEEKKTVKLHSFSATCKTNDGAISSLERTERMKSLRSTNTAVKVKSSSLNEHLTVPYPEVLLCVEVYHNRRTWLKTQEFLVLGRQYLTELRDGIYCSTDNMMQKAKQHDPSGYFLIEDSFYNDTRDPLAIDYSEPILDWLKNSKEDALKKWECITSGQLQKKQKAIIGDTPDMHLPRFKAHKMHKTRFCDLRFRLGAGYLYCHQGDCKHTIVIRDMRLINEEDVNNRAAYPILLFQIKLRIQKCFVCKIARAEKVTVDDKWAPENPCYFCKNCYFLLHYNLDGSLLYTDFSVFDYHHD